MEALEAGVTARLKKNLAGLQGAHKNYLEEIYHERYEAVKTILAGNETVTAPRAVAYLEALVAEILKANPVLNASELRAGFSNDLAPNDAFDLKVSPAKSGSVTIVEYFKKEKR